MDFKILPYHAAVAQISPTSNDTVLVYVNFDQDKIQDFKDVSVIAIAGELSRAKEITIGHTYRLGPYRMTPKFLHNKNVELKEVFGCYARVKYREKFYLLHTNSLQYVKYQQLFCGMVQPDWLRVSTPNISQFYRGFYVIYDGEGQVLAKTKVFLSKENGRYRALDDLGANGTENLFHDAELESLAPVWAVAPGDPSREGNEVTVRGIMIAGGIGDVPGLDELSRMWETGQDKIFREIAQDIEDKTAVCYGESLALIKEKLKRSISNDEEKYKEIAAEMKEVRADLQRHALKIARIESNKNNVTMEAMTLLKAGWSDFSFTGNVITTVTPPVVINHGAKFALGRYKIEYPIEDVMRTKIRHYDRSGHLHPHVHSTGEPCWGNAAAIIDGFGLEGNLYGALTSIYNFLSEYNPGSPILSISHFDGLRVG